MPDERTSAYMSEYPSNGVLSNLSPTLRQMSEERTPYDRIERESVPTVYHTARMQREDARHLEDPLSNPKSRSKERKTLQFANGNSDDDDDVSDTPPRPTPKAKSNGKVERTQHSTRRHHGTSKRAEDTADTREGQSQHSQAKKSHCSPSIRHTTSPHTPRRKKERTRASRSTSRSALTDSEREGRKGSRRRKNPDPPSSSDCSTSEDDDDVHDRPKHTLKPPKFDGQGSFETYMAQFMNCAKHNKWTRADKLAYLRNSLDKEAANILWDYGTEVTESLSGLTRILESTFGGQAVSDKHRIELRNRRCRKNETLQSLHSDVCRLAALAYPEAQPKTREVISCDHFLDAIADPDLELKIREHQPSDLDSALNIALQLEVWSADSERRREVQEWKKVKARKFEKSQIKQTQQVQITVDTRTISGNRVRLGIPHRTLMVGPRAASIHQVRVASILRTTVLSRVPIVRVLLFVHLLTLELTATLLVHLTSLRDASTVEIPLISCEIVQCSLLNSKDSHDSKIQVNSIRHHSLSNHLHSHHNSQT